MNNDFARSLERVARSEDPREAKRLRHDQAEPSAGTPVLGTARRHYSR
jgi:hypothetical protein